MITKRRFRWLKYLFLVTFPSFVLPLIILELVFRSVIPASDPPHAYFDPNEQIFKFDVNGPRTGKFTAGNLAQIRGKWRVNNEGWISDIDYVREGRDKPLVAIIGDSMLVALQVNVEDNVAGQLRQRLGKDFDVYGFGTSGAPFSHYLHMSRYVNSRFDPDILVFNILSNDFDQSLCDVWRPLAMLCLRDQGSEIEESEIVPYNPSRIRRLARHSSLVRYLFLNLELDARFSRTAQDSEEQADEALTLKGQVPLNDRIDRATDYILRKIEEENEARTVVFMMDAPRPSIYQSQSAGENEFELWLHTLIEAKTRKYRFNYIDLTDSFIRSFQDNRRKFEFDQDPVHWNKYGHAVAADALDQALKGIFAAR